MFRLTLESWCDVRESGSQVEASTLGDVRASGRLYSSRLQMASIGTPDLCGTRSCCLVPGRSRNPAPRPRVPHAGAGQSQSQMNFGQAVSYSYCLYKPSAGETNKTCRDSLQLCVESDQGEENAFCRSLLEKQL